MTHEFRKCPECGKRGLYRGWDYPDLVVREHFRGLLDKDGRLWFERCRYCTAFKTVDGPWPAGEAAA